MALALKGETYLPMLPAEIKDANEWLKCGATTDDVLTLLNQAQGWLALEVERVGGLEGLERRDALQQVFSQAAGLTDFALAEFVPLI